MVHAIARGTVLLGALASCSAFNGERPYQATPLPANVTELFRVFGDTGADTVWIFEQGGPIHILKHDPLHQFRHYPGHAAVQFVQVHQTLTINHDLADHFGELSFAELQAEVDVSVEILRRTIEHFKAQGKRLVVIGHSYGAFLVTRYLWREGPDGADLSRVLYVYGREDMIVGRLTEDEERFLTSRGASVMAVSAGHASMFEDSEVARRIAAALSQRALAPAP